MTGHKPRKQLVSTPRKAEKLRDQMGLAPSLRKLEKLETLRAQMNLTPEKIAKLRDDSPVKLSNFTY